MKRFQFKLQAVLTLRQRAEQTALENYSRAIQARQTAAGRVAESEMQLSEARRQWLHELADGCPAARAAQSLEFCRVLEDRKGQCDRALNLADLDLNRASQAMLLARQQREALEKLLARQRANHERHLRDEERRLIDDLIGRRPPLSFSGKPVLENFWN